MVHAVRDLAVCAEQSFSRVTFRVFTLKCSDRAVNGAAPHETYAATFCRLTTRRGGFLGAVSNIFA